MSQSPRNLADREHAAKHLGLYSVQLGAKRKNPYNNAYQGVTRDIICHWRTTELLNSPDSPTETPSSVKFCRPRGSRPAATKDSYRPWGPRPVAVENSRRPPVVAVVVLYSLGDDQSQKCPVKQL